MTSSFVLPTLSILILFCAVNYTYGLKCWVGKETGDLSSPVPDPKEPPKETECPTGSPVVLDTCMIVVAKADGILYACSPTVPDMKCANLADSVEGKKGNIGPVFCKTDGCNTKEFLKTECKVGGPGPGGPPGGKNNNTNTTTTAHYTHAPSYFTLFMAYAVVLTVAGITHSKIQS